jgi:aspartokinase/homoserine dehydrogenase 1
MTIVNFTSGTDREVVHLVIAGARGRVGSALRQQLARIECDGVDLRLFVDANRSTTTIHFTDRPIHYPTDWSVTIALVRKHLPDLGRVIFVDCTASEEVAALYAEFLRSGISIVTPNKIASAGPLLRFLELKELSREQDALFLHETTVGAALPLLRPVAELLATGDRVRSIEGVLSGPLSFILSRIHSGQRFSDAVAEAIERGLTEPDPTIDLSGADVGRKLLILLRESGHAFYESAVEVDPLIPPSIEWNGSIPSFLASLRNFDDTWRNRADDATLRKRRLVYAASFDGQTARAGVAAIAEDHPLARARAGENVVVIHTDRYNHVPLTISGPGAGPEVTASGVLAEVLHAAGVRKGGSRRVRARATNPVREAARDAARAPSPM